MYKFLGFYWTGPQLVFLGMLVLVLATLALIFGAVVDVVQNTYQAHFP
jgi:hypothetical protein